MTHTIRVMGVPIVSVNDKNRKAKDEIMESLIIGLYHEKLHITAPLEITITACSQRPVHISNIDISPIVDGLIKSGAIQNGSPEYLSKITIESQKSELPETKITLKWEK